MNSLPQMPCDVQVARSSESKIGIPSNFNIDDIVVLPIPIDPVIPMIFIDSLFLLITCLQFQFIVIIFHIIYI